MSLIFICFDLFWFNSNLRRIRFIELSSERDTPILDQFQFFFGFCVFSIRSFKFWVRRMVFFRWRTVYYALDVLFWTVLYITYSENWACDPWDYLLLIFSLDFWGFTISLWVKVSDHLKFSFPTAILCNPLSNSNGLSRPMK